MTIIIEVIVLLIIIISAADGWRRGLLLKLYGLIRFIAAIVLTIVLTPILCDPAFAAGR